MNLEIDGAWIAVTGQPNQTLRLFRGARDVDATLVLNEQIPIGGGQKGIRVRALHLVVREESCGRPVDVADVVLAAADASVRCSCP